MLSGHLQPGTQIIGGDSEQQFVAGGALRVGGEGDMAGELDSARRFAQLALTAAEKAAEAAEKAAEGHRDGAKQNATEVRALVEVGDSDFHESLAEPTS